MKPIAFKTNAARLRYRELFRVAGGPAMGFMACALKFFRILGPDNDGYGMRSFGDNLERLDMDSLPRHVREETASYRAKIEKLGFIPGFAYSLETFGFQEAHGQVFRHKDQLSAVSIAFARCVRNDAETLTTVVGFNSMLLDDSYIMTSGNKRLLNKPAMFQCAYMPGAAPKEVFERHMDRVERAGEKPRRIKSDDDLERLVLNCENEETDFNIERGFYVKMTRSEVELGQELKQQYEEDNDPRNAGPRRKKKKEDDEEDEDEDEDMDDEDDDSNY